MKYKKRTPIISIKPEEPVDPKINQDEVRLMRSFYDQTVDAEKKYRDEKENQMKFYKPIT